MNVFRATRSRRFACTLTVLLNAGLLAGCEPDEAELDEVPEVAEVQVDPVGVAVGPEGAAVVAEVELRELYPLGPDDIGKVIVANGTVVGRAIPDGFFLRTEGSQVLFVRSAATVSPGQTVRVVGPLGMTTQAIFDDWEVDAIEGEVEAEWEIQHLWYVDATAVGPV